MSEWSINPVGGIWFAIGVTAALVLLLAVKPRPLPSPRRLWSLRGLRLLAILMLAFALLRPTLTYTRSDPLPASLLLLADDSRSLSVEDSLGGKSRWEAIRTMINDSAESLRELNQRWDIAAYRFSNELQELPTEEGVPQFPEAPTGDGSALGASLAELIEREGGSRVAGVLLMTDGAQRAVAPRDLAPQTAARRLAAEGVPLYAFSFGLPTSDDRSDLAIEDLLASSTVFSQTPTEVRGRLRVQGYANRTLAVQLLWESKTGEMVAVDAQQVTTVAGVGTYPLRLRHTPIEPGEWKVSLSVTNQEGELLTGNNAQSTFVTVREGGVKVLQLVGTQRIGGQPGVEQRFVRSSLAASPDVVVTRRVFNYRRDELDLTLDLRTTPPDVFLIDNLDSRALNRTTWQAIAERVQAGTGLMMQGGHHSFGPGGFGRNVLAAVLPVGIGPAERQRFGEPPRTDVHVEGPLKVTPTLFGRRSPILRIGDRVTDELWTALPPLEGANRFDPSLLKPNAGVLLETTDGKKWPILVRGQAGEGRTLALAVDSTWRWPMRGQVDAHRRFWRQAMLWLAKKDDTTDSPVRVKLASRRVPRGAPLEFTATAKLADERPADNLRFQATVTQPDGSTVDTPLPRGVASVSGTFAAADQAGDYRVTVSVLNGDKKLGTASARFLVPDLDLELDNPAAEPALLAQMAATTSAFGGRALAPEELPDLLAQLAAAPAETSEDVVARITHWDTWPFFLLMVALLGVEWWLRKRWGLV